MGKQLVYLDHAATSFPKPESVYVAHDTYLRNAGNPGRGAHELALSSARSIFDTRSMAADFLGVENSERLIFTAGCTQSINMVMKGLKIQKGASVITSALEHNAVMRALRELEALNTVRVVVLPYASQNIVDPKHLRDAIAKEQPKLCVFTEASNVTGEKIDLKSISEICAAEGTPLLVDAAQTAGTEANCLRHPGITFWAAPGHKGLMGAPGVGLLFVREFFELTPLICGGTGSGSESFDMPKHYPDRLEAGTLPGPAIAALGAGIQSVCKTGASKIDAHQNALAKQFRDWCTSKEWISVCGRPANENANQLVGFAPIVSFNIDSLTADRVADVLNRDYKIAVRAGLHCAAMAHETLGTTATGAVRVSFGYTNTPGELEALFDALSAIHGK